MFTRLENLRLLIDATVDEAISLKLDFLAKLLLMAKSEFAENSAQLIGKNPNAKTKIPSTAFAVSQSLSSIVGSFEWDLQKDLIFCHSSLNELFGVPPGGNPILKFINAIHPADQERVWTAIENAISKGAPYNISYRVIHGDVEFHVIVIGAVIFEGKGSNRKATRFTGTVIKLDDDQEHVSMVSKIG